MWIPLGFYLDPIGILVELYLDPIKIRLGFPLGVCMRYICIPFVLHLGSWLFYKNVVLLKESAHLSEMLG